MISIQLKANKNTETRLQKNIVCMQRFIGKKVKFFNINNLAWLDSIRKRKIVLSSNSGVELSMMKIYFPRGFLLHLSSVNKRIGCRFGLQCHPWYIVKKYTVWFQNTDISVQFFELFGFVLLNNKWCWHDVGLHCIATIVIQIYSFLMQLKQLLIIKNECR